VLVAITQALKEVTEVTLPFPRLLQMVVDTVSQGDKTPLEALEEVVVAQVQQLAGKLVVLAILHQPHQDKEVMVAVVLQQVVAVVEVLIMTALDRQAATAQHQA
jgi:hypothetical protein